MRKLLGAATAIGAVALIFWLMVMVFGYLLNMSEEEEQKCENFVRGRKWIIVSKDFVGHKYSTSVVFVMKEGADSVSIDTSSEKDFVFFPGEYVQLEMKRDMKESCVYEITHE